MRKYEEGFLSFDHAHAGCVTDALQGAEHICAQRGARLTDLRRRVLERVWLQHKPVGAYEILEMLQKDGRTAPPTVYRALDFLQQMGLVHRIASLNAYVGCARPGDPHDGQFLICEACNNMVELDVSVITDAIVESAEAAGFKPRRHTVEILGLCPNCQ